jgi:ribosome biogenesis protein Nip4
MTTLRGINCTISGCIQKLPDCLPRARKPEGKIPLQRPRRRWEDNIRMTLREIGWEVACWIHLAKDRDYWWVFVNMVMTLPFP